MKDQPVKILSFLSLLFLLSPLQAQVNRCALNLIEAQKQFDAGQIEQVPDLLVDCIESGFSTEDRIAAFKLLINSYIFDDYPDLAEQYMLQFLNDYPEYEVQDDDPFEFVNLFEQFDNEPRYSAGFNLGTNLSLVRITEPFGVYNVNNVSGKYSISPGFHIGGNFNYFLNDLLELSLELAYTSVRINYEVEPFSFTKTEYKETQGRLDLPISLIYTFNDNNITPYGRAGFRTSYLLMSKAESARTYTTPGSDNFNEIVSDPTDILDYRVPLQFSAFLGGGFRYKIEKAYLFLDIRYNLGLTRQVDPSSRQDLNNDNVWLFYNMQDDFKLSDLSFTIGYSKIFYNTKRKN